MLTIDTNDTIENIINLFLDNPDSAWTVKSPKSSDSNDFTIFCNKCREIINTF